MEGGNKLAIVEVNGRKKEIPEETISKYIKILGITREDAIQMWLEDEGYKQNDEVEELTKKAKQLPRINAKSDTPRKKTHRERKPDLEKEQIIKILETALKNAGIDAKVTNSTKIIEFQLNNNSYKIDLTKKRPKKE